MISTKKYIDELKRNFIRINEKQEKAILNYWGKYIDDYIYTEQDILEQTRKVINSTN